MTISPGSGASAAMISTPGSPRPRIRPIGPGSPMRNGGLPRNRLAGGQSERSGRCDSRVCTIVMPALRQTSSSLFVVGMMACSRLTSLPSVAPKPPGSTKSRCMSITMSAALPGSKVYANGCAAIVITCLVRMTGHRRADDRDVGLRGQRLVHDMSLEHHHDAVRELQQFIQVRACQQH